VNSAGTLNTVSSNAGTLNVTDGTAGAITNTGTASVAGPASVGAVTNSSTFTNAGTVASIADNSAGTFVNSGTVTGTSNVTGGTVTNSGAMTGATTIGGSGQVDSTGTMGAVSNAGILNVNDGTAGAVTSTGTTLVGDGAGATATVASLDVDGGVTTVGTDGVVTGLTDIAAAGQVNSTGDLGDVTNAGTLNVDAGTADAVTNSGTANIDAGASTDAVANTGTLQVDGTIASLANSTAGGVATVSGTGIVSGASTNNGGTVNTAGTMAALDNQAGQVNVTGGTTGAVTNADDLNITGGAVDSVIQSAGDTTTGAAGTVTNDVTLNGGTLNNQGTIGGDVTTLAGTTSVNTGTVGGDVTNAGTLTSTSTIGGDLTNTSIAVVSGTVGGNVANTGAFDIAGTLGVGGGFANSGGGTFDVAAGETLTTGTGVTNAADAGVVNVEGIVNGGFTNAATNLVSNAGTFNGGLTNSGSIATTGGFTVGSGGFVNNGTVDMVNGSTADAINVAGGMSGTGIFNLDANLDSAAPGGLNSDTVVVTGGATTGDYVLNFNITSAGTPSIADPAVLVFDVDDTFGAAGNSYSFGASGLPPSGGQVVYGLIQNGNGDLSLAAQPNPGIGAIAGNVVLTQSLIGTVINRPSSPFVSGLAYEDDDSCGTGTWGRFVGGSAEVSGATANSVSNISSTVDAKYYGLQVGGDWGCFNGTFGGWDLAFGGIFGVNEGTTSQPVFAVNQNNATQVTNTVTSITDGDFRQTYAGLYLAAAKGALSADLQVRTEQTEYEFTNTAVVAGSGLGLTNSKLKTKALTVSGALSYAIPLQKEGWTFVPTAGFGLTQTKAATLTFDDGATLQTEDSSTAIGFVGGTLAKTFFGEDGTSATNVFATGTYYNDFGKERRSVYTDAGGATQNLTSENLGAYSELSFGVNYVKILDEGKIGPAKQLNASIRADGRFSGSVSSYGLTAQLRLQF
ncbi:beta strand repeat-containing protein, partial [Litoreibacter albidus]